MPVVVSGDSGLGLPSSFQRTLIDGMKAVDSADDATLDSDPATGRISVRYDLTAKLAFLFEGDSLSVDANGHATGFADRIRFVDSQTGDVSMAARFRAGISLSHLFTEAKRDNGAAEPHNYPGFYGILFPSPVEQVTYKGGALDDIIEGSEFDDLLRGGQGDDIFYVSFGNDTIKGGLGKDDVIDASAVQSQTGVSVDLAAGSLSGIGSLLIIAAAVDGVEHVNGTSRADVLRGDNGTNRIDGGKGADRIFGGGGSDTLIGGGNSDLLDGGNGGDLLRGGAGNDTLKGKAGADTLIGGNGKDVLNGGFGFDVLRGGAGQDDLRGGAGSDTLVGGGGNDVLSEGDGAGRLLGGAGADVFVFDKGDSGTTSTAMDVVADFEVGVDTLRLQGVNSADVSVSVQAGDTVVSYTNSSGETQFIRVENTTLTIGDIDGLL